MEESFHLVIGLAITILTGIIVGMVLQHRVIMKKSEIMKILANRIEELHDTPDAALRLEVNNFWYWFKYCLRK